MEQQKGVLSWATAAMIIVSREKKRAQILFGDFNNRFHGDAKKVYRTSQNRPKQGINHIKRRRFHFGL